MIKLFMICDYSIIRYFFASEKVYKNWRPLEMIQRTSLKVRVIQWLIVFSFMINLLIHIFKSYNLIANE
jgi:hypothetical protein